MLKHKIALSILSANFLELKKILDIIKNTKIVKQIHYDVMDYDFVNNLSFGPHILKNITDYMKEEIFIDCHMMVRSKNLSIKKYLEPFIKAKANMITFHYESLTKDQLKEFLTLKKLEKIKIGLAIKPKTDIKEIIPFISQIDLVLVMSVEPGFGGQSFILNCANKINELRNYINKNKLSTLIQVDGGVNSKTISLCKNADIVVIGNYLATANNEKEFIDRIQKLYE